MEIVKIEDHYEVWDYKQVCRFKGSEAECEDFIFEIMECTQ